MTIDKKYLDLPLGTVICNFNWPMLKIANPRFSRFVYIVVGKNYHGKLFTAVLKEEDTNFRCIIDIKNIHDTEIKNIIFTI